MVKIKRTAIAAILALHSICGLAAWEQVGGNDTQVFYSDRSTIKKHGSTVMMWSMIDFSKPQYFGKAAFRSVIRKDEFDCKRDRLRIVAAASYAGQKGSGDVLFNTSEVQDWQYMAPGTISQDWMRIACAKG